MTPYTFHVAIDGSWVCSCAHQKSLSPLICISGSYSCQPRMRNCTSLMIKAWITLLISSSCTGEHPGFSVLPYITRLLYSLAFLIYALVVTLIHLWATAGRNAPEAGADASIELTSPTKWYAPVPDADVEAERHVIGDDD